jgi:hypothetical protein
VAGLVSASGLTWEIARAGGLMAYGLLTASVVIGLIVSLKWRSPRWTRFISTELHRFVTLLALVFTVLHTITVAIDPFIKFTPVEVLVPFVSHYRPLWIGLGIVAAYLMVAIYLSDRIRSRVGYGWWRRFHYLSFAVFVLALLHGLGTGSDTRTPWATGMYAASVILVVALLSVRAFPPKGERTHPLEFALVLAALIAAGYWAWQGPLQSGWNTVANNDNGSGNGSAVVTTSAPPSAGPGEASSQPSASPGRPQPFSDQLSGTLTQVADGTVVLSAKLVATGDQLTLQFPNPQGGQLSAQGATVSLLAPNGDSCSGPVQSLDRSGLVAACQGASTGSVWLLRLALAVADGGAVQGSIRATPG